MTSQDADAEAECPEWVPLGTLRGTALAFDPPRISTMLSVHMIKSSNFTECRCILFARDSIYAIVRICYRAQKVCNGIQ